MKLPNMFQADLKFFKIKSVYNTSSKRTNYIFFYYPRKMTDNIVANFSIYLSRTPSIFLHIFHIHYLILQNQTTLDFQF